MALMKWKLQHKALGVLCLLLIAASQVSRILPAHDRLLFSLSRQSELHSSFIKTDNARIANHGAPFIREINVDSKPKRSTFWKNSSPKSMNNANAAVSAVETASSSMLISQQGYVGPFSSLSNEEVALFPKIMKDWQKLMLNYAEKLTEMGLEELYNASCYLWLTDCYKLAEHSGILKHVKELLGERVVAYGMRFWEAQAESERKMEMHYEGYGCNTVHVLAGSGVKLIKGSYFMDARMALDVWRLLPQLEGAIVSRVTSHVRRDDVKLVYLDAGPNDILVLSGKGVYAAINTANQSRVSMLVQFASADCKLRDPQLVQPSKATPISNRLPPALLVSGFTSGIDVMNDIRLSMATQEVMVFVEGQGIKDNFNVNSSGSYLEGNVTVFRGVGVDGIYKSTHGFSEKTYGIGFSPLLHRIKVDCLTSIGTVRSSKKFVSHAYDEVVVVLDGLLMHHRTAKELTGVQEVKELAVGHVAYLSNRLWHALVEALPGTSFILVSWAVEEPPHLPLAFAGSSLRRSISQGIYLFEEPLAGLGALEGKTVVLQGGQAYDPANDMGSSDVLVVVVKGLFLQVLPLSMYLEKSDVLLIPMGVPCVLWNTSKWPVVVVVLHFYQESAVSDAINSYLQEASYRTSGRIMR
ncbi:hypothetical protein O6H91_09G087300 [Diphasiastrum complanatum]|uniref:Uncharacterized protein n=1 Tax=Diphasiastrum complanatum TaxID=34168 RepID=A0ACC2CRM6_DIPCM|nr:hypothetical protein O6H91_09G087300 [Diphasiastrum complanatum]